MIDLSNVSALVASGALFAVNHSGGKDSQAMMIELLAVIPRSQLVVVHASLGEIEWEGALELARDQAAAAGVPFIVATAVKSFFDMVEHRFAVRPESPSWPSASNRQCTSDLKRGPIDRELRRYAAANGFTTVVSCAGIRAAESVSRSKANPFKKNERNTIPGRAWFDWCPIFTLTTDEVFATIKADGQEPHPAYALGNARLSCMFCIMASPADLKNAARHNRPLFDRYVELEKKTGYTMHMSRKSLVEIVAAAVAAAA